MTQAPGRLSLLLSTIALMAAIAPQRAASAVLPVDLELSLLVDNSGSVDAGEFALQRNGYADAFRSPAIHQAITSTAAGRLGRIAVNMIYWSNASEQSEVVPWTLIDSPASAGAFGDAIAATSQLFFGSTAPGSAIAFATPRFTTNGFEGVHKAIDVSGDGEENDGVPTASARYAALAGGLDRINGLAILGGEPGLLAFYQSSVQGGPNSFTLAAAGFADFGDAVARKLEYEITGTSPIPLPAAVYLLLAGLFGVGAIARVKRAE